MTASPPQVDIPSVAAVSPCGRSIAEIRAWYRQHDVPARYSGPLHFCFTGLFALSGIGASVLFMDQVTLLEWLTVPLTFLYANLAEYIGHRGPMHRRHPLLALVFHGHTHVHHRFYTRDAFAYEQPSDWHALLLPWYLIVFFLALFGLPGAALLHWLLGANVACLFLATALAYFLTYELLHFCYHAPEHSILLRAPLLRRLRRHHLIHHSPALMTRYNFNITFPIFDWLFGTTCPHRDALTSVPVCPSKSPCSSNQPVGGCPIPGPPPRGEVRPPGRRPQ